MKSIKLLLIGAVISVQVLVEAGSYTVTACSQSETIHAWDSDGGYGKNRWFAPGIVLLVGKNDLFREMETRISYSIAHAATITYRGKTIKFKKPSDEIVWKGEGCFQYFGNY